MQTFAKYQWLSSCRGIELHILPDSSISYRICEISLDKNSLTIDSKVELEGDIATVVKKVPKDKPVALTITGKGVLIRKTAQEEELSSDKLLKLFPNLKPEQFYIQNFITGPSSFVAIIRKEVIYGIITAFNSAEIKCLLVNIGPFAASHILTQVNFYGDDIRFDGHHIKLTEKSIWEDYKYQAGSNSDFPLKIDIEPIKEQFLLAYAAAFQLQLYHKVNTVNLPVDTVEDALENFEQKQKFNFRLATILGSFFVLLLLNFLLFNYYNSKNEVLLAQVNQSSASVESLQQLEKGITEKEKQLKELGWNKGMNYAWLADQIGQSVPSTVTLNELALNPLNITESNRQRKNIYQTGIIKASGLSTDLNAVNDWIYKLKSEPWVKQVRLDNFSPSNKEENKQQFSFTILLK